MASEHGLQIFPNASNAMIVNPTITVNRDPKPNPSERFGLQELLKNISKDSFHDAAERSDPPRCHPQTRKAVRAEIMEWITAPSTMRKLILWMHGPAGSGKSAIAQTIAEECERLGFLAAAFFFWRTAVGRNNASQFVATIAYQLSRCIPQMKNDLFTAIEDDPAIFSRSLSTQMRVLVVKPLKLVAPYFPMPIFSIVDAVDECGPNGRSQSELLHLLGSVVSELQPLPIIFFLSSRPEYDIREAFDGNLLRPLTKVLVLDNRYKPDEDIKLYFQSTFSDIYGKHYRLGRRLPSPWPTADNVNSLVSKASGQFIFAATVTKFVDSPRHNPADRLDIILRLSADGDETPFALLDTLYRFVLGSVTDIEKVLDILAFILLSEGHINSLNEAEELLGIEFRSTLVDMHSLVDVPPPGGDKVKLPSIYHASLEDFLMDQLRSHRYYIDRSGAHLRFSRLCLKTIIENHEHLQYLSLQGLLHEFFSHGEKSPSEDFINDLAQFDLRVWLEEISDLHDGLYHVFWDEFFDCVKKQAGPDRFDIFIKFQNDFDTFIFNRIEKYPPSLRAHIPILLCELEHLIIPDIFIILLHGAANSAEEYNAIVNLDIELLQILEDISDLDVGSEGCLSGLLKDKSRAGEYFVDGGNYVALVRTIISIICAKPGERNYGMVFEKSGTGVERYLKDGCDPTKQISLEDLKFDFFQGILKEASTDWDLANFLLERTVHFRDDMEPISGRIEIAKASIEYIQRCGIPFLEHSHPPDMNKCAICDCREDAIVVQNILDTPTEQLPLLLSNEDIDDFLAAVDAFDATATSQSTHIMDISVAPNGALMYSFVGEAPFGYLM